MPQFQAVTQSGFAPLRWKRYDNYLFAAQDTLAGLVVQELPKAAMSMPVAFVQVDGHFMPAALQGLQQGQNLLVSPDGRWLAPYTPAAYRGHPFMLADKDDGQHVLCIDTESGLVGEQHAETFFDESGQPSTAIQGVLSFLQNIRANKTLTQAICAALQSEDLISPWPLTVKNPEGELSLQGLYRIDETKFNQLGSEALHRLHQAGALPMVYCQLLSMQHVQTLGQLAEARAQALAQKAASPPAEIDLEFLKQNPTIRFGD
jgi:hypothetical protein